MENISFLSMFKLEADNREQLLDEIYDTLYRQGYVKESFRDAVHLREDTYPTGIMTKLYGVAIPHVDVEHVTKNGVCVVTLKNPVEFGMMGGAPSDKIEVECLFVILLNARTSHMKTLVRFMKVLRNEDDLKRVYESCSNEEIEEILLKYIVE